MAVKITTRKYTSGPKEGQEIVAVESPYSSEFVEGARKLNGTFDRAGGRWLFSPLIRDKVESLCMDVYGENGRDTPNPRDLVTLRVTTPTAWGIYGKSLEIGGRVLARAYGRDSGAKLGDDVILVTGKIKSGGSVKNWSTDAIAGTVFEVLNMPRKKAEELVASGCGDLILEIQEQVAPNVSQADIEKELLAVIADCETKIAEARAKLKSLAPSSQRLFIEEKDKELCPTS